MTQPKISVIVTTYNTEKYITKCLNALRNQTFSNIEIICIDDCSTDNTVEIIKQQIKQDKRIRLIALENNSGVSAARNQGLKTANAEYIMFCDGDDYYDKTMCEKMYNAISQYHTDLVISEIGIIYQAHQEMKLSDDYYYSLKYNDLHAINDNLIFFTDLAPANKIFKRSLINKYNLAFPEGLHYEDAYFCTAYFCISHTVFYLNERLYNYVRHEDSIMSDTWSKKNNNDIAIEHLFITFKLFDFLEQNDLLKQYNQLFWRLFENFELFAINNSKTKEQVKVVKQAARDFIAKHQEYFDKANATVRENIQHNSSSKKIHVSSVRLKRWIMRFMPIYRYSTDNIQRLRTLKVKNEQLLNQIQKDLEIK